MSDARALGMLVVSSSTFDEVKASARLALDHHHGRVELWKAARENDRLLLIEPERGRVLACRVFDKSIQRPIVDDPLPDRPWFLGLKLVKWGGGQEHDVRGLVLDRFPFRPYRHLRDAFDRLWRLCRRPVQGPTLTRVPPRLRGHEKRYAISVALTAEEDQFVSDIGELHPQGPTRRDQQFAIVARRDGVLCGAVQVGLPRPNAPQHHLAARRFGDEFDALRRGAVSIVRLLARHDAINRFAVHRALLEEVCDVAPNMVRPKLTYIDGASYQYHPLAPKFGFVIETPRSPKGAFYFWKPYDIPRRLARYADPQAVQASRARVRLRLARRAEDEMRSWIVRASNDKNVRAAIERRLWALVDSSVNTARWKAVNRGDTVLFVRGDRITHIATVGSTERSTKAIFQKYPLLIQFASIEAREPALLLAKHIDGDSLREIRRAKGGIVEARGLNINWPTDRRPKRDSAPSKTVRPSEKSRPQPTPPVRAAPPQPRAARSSIGPEAEVQGEIPVRPAEKAEDGEVMRSRNDTPVPSDRQDRPASPRVPKKRQPTTRRRRRARLEAGAQITGYALRRRLGRGQSAEVWLADVEIPPLGTDLNPGEQVAIKFYLTTLLHWQRQAIRIQREFLVASEIEHPHIARVHDLVLSPNRPLHSFMVMDFVEGRTLKALLEERVRLNALEVAEIGRQLLDALVALHALDALHRDIKVANIMVKSQPNDRLEVVLLDLGIVSVASEPGMTATSVFVGSPYYAPLEQLEGKPLSVRSDIYGVGATMYHLYTGRSMYADAGAIGGIVVAMLKTPQRLPTDGTDGAERALAEFVNRCIENEARHRPASAEAALDELSAILDQLSAAAEIVGPRS